MLKLLFFTTFYDFSNLLIVQALENFDGFKKF